MLISFLLSTVIGCWAWYLLIPHCACDHVPSPISLAVAMRRVTAIDLITLTLLFAIYQAEAFVAVLAWLVIRFSGVYTLYRYGWYWLADWASAAGRCR